MKLNWNFLGGWGAKQKTFRGGGGGEYGYFLKLHSRQVGWLAPRLPYKGELARKNSFFPAYGFQNSVIAIFKRG